MKLDSQQHLQSDVLRATTIHLLVAGAVAKFALDSHDTFSRTTWLVAGAIVAVMGLVHVGNAQRAAEHVKAEIDDLNDHLQRPLKSTELLPLTYTLRGARNFCRLALAFFVALAMAKLLDLG